MSDKDGEGGRVRQDERKKERNKKERKIRKKETIYIYIYISQLLFSICNKHLQYYGFPHISVSVPIYLTGIWVTCSMGTMPFCFIIRPQGM